MLAPLYESSSSSDGTPDPSAARAKMAANCLSGAANSSHATVPSSPSLRLPPPMHNECTGIAAPMEHAHGRGAGWEVQGCGGEDTRLRRLVPAGMARTERPQLLRERFDQFVVIDFEATCEKDTRIYPQEIIEFPAVLVDAATGRPLSEFRTLAAE
ncbi:hypothetical protein BAE44_0014997 [Dichanthelium oligosanthes]|uniref:Exonuclease domain-containing protein n=1 Tax=Dichanthelium oligosanthes TaxID=888268 RepID=A0A1E5VFS3_9POAL|nr:hypothetical protein BAE44_0014997 [Dichanthelium oligosanthes]